MSPRHLGIAVLAGICFFSDSVVCEARDASCSSASDEEDAVRSNGLFQKANTRKTRSSAAVVEEASAAEEGVLFMSLAREPIGEHKVAPGLALTVAEEVASAATAAGNLVAKGSALQQGKMSRHTLPDGPQEHATEHHSANVTEAAPLESLLVKSSRLLRERHLREPGIVAQAAAAAGAFVAAGWGFSRYPVASRAASAEAERSMLLDNAKVCSLFFVIFGHFIYYNLWGDFVGQKAVLTGAEDTLALIMGAISPLKLPIFCFISGICSQGETTAGRLRRFFVFLVAPTVIWTFFAKPVIYDTLIDGSFGSAWDRFKQAMMLNAFHNEWYLQALIFWRGSAFLIWNHLRPSAAVVGMFGVSLAGGYMNFASGPAVNLKIDETLGYLPYFAIGFVFPYEQALHAIPKPRPIGSALVLVAVVAYTVWLSSEFGDQLPNGHGPYGAINDKKVWEVAGQDSLAHSLYWLRRLAKVLLDLTAGLVFMFLVIPRGETFLSWAGQHTLHPYVWHIMAMTWLDVILSSIHLPVVKSGLGHAVVIGLNIVVCLLLLAIFSAQPWRSLFAWCFHPTWLQITVEKDRGTGPPSGGCRDAEREDPGAQRGILASSSASSSQPKPDLDASGPWYQRQGPGASSGSKDGGPTRSASPHGSPGGDDASPRLSPPKRNLSRASFPSTATLNSTGSRASREETFKSSVALPTMQESKVFAKYVLPIVVFLVAAPIAWFLTMIGPDKAVECVEHIPLWILVPTAAVGFIYSSIVRYYYHFCRLEAGTKPPTPPPADKEPFLHVCVVVEYQEPLEVLMRTVTSIARQSHIGRRPVLVMACEARDQERHETGEVLRSLCGDSVEDFIMTEHVLQPGENVGKHSNENHAVREVYRQFVEEQGMSPFQIMLTIIDADSILSEFYLAHIESAFHQMPDGRRLIYNGPLNTYRNLDEAGLLVQCMEIVRCHADVFHDPMIPYHPQSNYSMTLGMAQEIDYWLPDCISEDMKCHVKALANNFGSQTTVSVPAFICNDLVVSVYDRYVQAKRHQWGSVEEFPWHMKLAYDSPLNFRLWWAVFSDECSRQGSLFHVSLTIQMKIMGAIMFYFIITQRPDFLLNPRCVFIFAVVAAAYVLQWMAEIFLWNRFLTEFSIHWPSNCRLGLLVLLSPILEQICSLVFFIGASLDCVFHITFRSHYLTYINAPKGSGVGGK